jgi:ABC-2 type transport system permease protein
MLLAEFALGSSKEVTVNVTESVIVPTFHMVHFFLIVQVPLLTMRVFAEDEATGMMDLLQTTPIRDWSLLTGKFAATATAMGLYVVLTAAYPITTAFLGSVEWPVVIGSIFALLFATSAYTAVGVFFSSLTESQVVASVLSYVALFLFVFAHAIGSGSGIPAIEDATRHFTVTEHIEGLLSGDIAPMNFMYFVAMAAIFLFLSARMLEARRWRA